MQNQLLSHQSNKYPASPGAEQKFSSYCCSYSTDRFQSYFLLSEDSFLALVVKLCVFFKNPVKKTQGHLKIYRVDELQNST